MAMRIPASSPGVLSLPCSLARASLAIWSVTPNKGVRTTRNHRTTGSQPFEQVAEQVSDRFHGRHRDVRELPNGRRRLRSDDADAERPHGAGLAQEAECPEGM